MAALPRFRPNRVRPDEAPELVASRNFDAAAGILDKHAKEIDGHDLKLDALGRKISQTTNVLQALKNQVFNVLDYGATLESSDNSAAVLAAAAAASASSSPRVLVPPGVKFNTYTVLATLPTNVTIDDQSQVNDFSSAGETTKRIGLLSKDEAASDTHQAIMSDHHAILNTNNYGGAGTTSASERKASWIWSVGQFVLGLATKRGFRGAGIFQFTKETGGTFWKLVLRSLAPWAAIGGSYELWDVGQVISGAGVYCYTGDNHYVSTGAGTTGATMPTHTTGTVSDGGVSWTFVDSADRSVWSVDQYGRHLTGLGPGTDSFRHKINKTDPGGGNYIMDLAATGVSQIVLLKLNPTDAAGAEALQPYLRAEVGSGLRVMRTDGSTEIASFSDTTGLIASEFAMRHGVAADGATTPSVNGISTLYTANTGATSITALTSSNDDQVVNFVFGDTNTTLVHSSTFFLKDGINVKGPLYGSIRFLKVPTSISDRWIEVDRSFNGVAVLKSETFSDANKTVTAGTQYLAQTGTMTASRTVTLPAASGYPRGTQLIIADESGTTSVAFTLVIAGAGLDTINGVTSITIGIAGGYDTITLMPDGISKWTVLSKI